MRKNIYLLNEDHIVTFTDHEAIDMQIRISRVLIARKKAIERVFNALGKMTDSEIMLHAEEIKGTLNLLNSNCVDSSEFDLFDKGGIGLDQVLYFWKDGNKYYDILEKVGEMVQYY